MTATTLENAPAAASAAPASFATRIANVVRLHVANPWPTLGTPWLILLTIFAMTYVIWHLIAANVPAKTLEEDGFSINGGMGFIFVYMIVVAAQTMNQSFLFGLGMSITRRDYYVGTLVFCASLALFYGSGLTALMAIERATDGWGVGGQFFQPFGIQGGTVGDYALGYLVAMFAMFAIGISFGAVFARWGGTGITAAILATVGAFIAAAWLIGRLDAWEAVWSALGDAGSWAIAGGVLAAVAFALAAGFVVFRRTAPRA